MELAIVGIKARLPGCKNIDSFWSRLKENESFIKPISQERWALMDPASRERIGSPNKLQGMFLEDIDKFDRELFNVSPAWLMFSDPRQRLLLECCREVFEDAGIKLSSLSGKKAGVFIAHDGWDFGAYEKKINAEDLPSTEFVIPGNNPCFLANRISSLFNFYGPSTVVNTTCSGVYVALHYAQQAFEKGECDYAIVGGVCLSLDAVHDQYASSKRPEMKSFSRDATGFVSSEGGGAILLRPLDQSVKDRDDIYGILLGTGTNSGGKTNSFAQPNQQCLTDLFKDTILRANLRPSDIDYIEAHGAASLMGDAIEGNALIDVFKPVKASSKQNGKPTCYISTIKPNLGHAHAASGIYSLLKAVLSFKFNEILPIFGLKRKHLNKDLTVRNTGIEFLTQAIPWKPRYGRRGDKRVPRYVFLSSYGFSNVNAAVIVKEHIGNHDLSKSIDIHSRQKSHLVCLSAKSESQLHQQAHRLSEFLDEQQISEKDKHCTPEQLAYTLQFGREEMDYRLAIVVKTIGDLQEALRKYLTKESSNALTTGWAKSDNPLLNIFKRNQNDLKLILDQALETKDLEKLAAFWISGIDIQWDPLYEKKPQKVHLPTYPFVQKRYWIEGSRFTVHGSRLKSKLHPLVHENTSDFEEQRFSSTFSGEELFLTDHRVLNDKVLPGVAYLEMARAAAEQAGLEQVHTLQDVIWASPIRVTDKAKTVTIALYPEHNGAGYEVMSGEDTVHSQGKIINKALVEAPQALDIAAIRERCKKTIESKQFYATYRRLGLHYGSSFQGTKTLHYNGKEALARIELPVQADFALNPALLDCALQASIGSGISKLDTTKNNLYVPFALKEVQVFGPLSGKNLQPRHL